MKNIIKETDHSIILVKRIENEMINGNIENALYLAETFVFLFSEYEPATSKLVDLFMDYAKKLFKDKRLEDTEIVVNKALVIKPGNSNLLSLLVEIKKEQRKLLISQRRTVKSFAYSFVEKFYPEELNIFDIAWRVFKDLQPDDFKQEAVAGALGIVGQEASELKTPKIIITLNQLNKKDFEELSAEQVKNTITKTGLEVGSSRELIENFSEFLLDKFHK
jgi:hypothetical protein